MAEEFEIVPNKKAKSDLWKHFGLKLNKKSNKIYEGVAICKLCKQTVKNSGGTTNLKTHIERHHPSQLCLQSKREQSHELSQREPEAKKQKALDSMLGMKYAFNSPRAMSITRGIAGYIVDELRPLSVVEGPGFENMIHILDPRYSIPGKTYFAQTLIPKMYEEAAVKVKSSLALASTVALTTDGWTSRATESYVTITSVHITLDWKLQNFVLQTRALPESHTGVNIAEVIKEAITEWGITTPHPPLVSNNAANMLVAGKELLSKPHIGCFAHTLNLAAQKALKINTVSRILARVRKVAGFFHRSTTAASVLKTKTKLLGLRDVKLVCDVPTRWNSAADMLERYLQLQPAIYATLLSTDINTGKNTEINVLNENDARLAEDIMKCLAPLKIITEAICTEKTPTVSIILPLMKKVEIIMADTVTDSQTIKSVKEAVTRDLENRYSNIELKNFLEECTVLDPRFKDRCFEPGKLQDIYHRLSVLLTTGEEQVKPPQMSSENIQPASASTSADTSYPEELSGPELLSKKTFGLASLFDDVVNVKEEKGHKTIFERADDEINKYKVAPQISVENDPLLWWKENCINYPLLANIVKCRLCIPATSVPSERIFSTAGDIVTAQRARLSSTLVDKLISLKKNFC